MVCYMQNNSVFQKILNNRYYLEYLTYHTQVVTITVFFVQFKNMPARLVKCLAQLYQQQQVCCW